MVHLHHLVSRVAQCLIGSVFLALFTQPVLGAEPDPIELFNKRIMPIFQSENPSSCVQCHLSSVDLKNYILPSSEATFVSLRDQGMIDLEQPESSKILQLIRMGEKDLDEGAKLIHEETRNAELEAFVAWVKACCTDKKLRDLPSAPELARPDVPDEVIRHARKSRVVDSFVRNVWSQRMRCFPCHTPNEIDPNNPMHTAAIKTRKKFEEEYDDKMMARLNLFRETPEETLKYLVKRSESAPVDQLPMLNLADPANSLLIQKPMSKLPARKADGTFEDPSYRLPVSHMGGLKMHPNDQSYKSIVAWIDDYAKVVEGEYRSIEDLPADNWYPTQLVVRVTGAPDTWSLDHPVQLFIHEWDPDRDQWNDEPVAFTQGTMTPRRIVNGALFLLGSNGDGRIGGTDTAPTLPGGRYLVKVYVDRSDKIARNPSVILDHEDYAGSAEIPQAKWRSGFKFAEVVDGKDLIQP